MRRHLVYAAAGAVVLALGGCGGGEPTPKVADPTAGPSASPSASESAAAKEPWEERSDDGAIAFVEHWLIEMNKAENSGNTTRFEALGADECQTCNQIAVYTEQLYESGGYSKSEQWQIESVSQPRPASDKTKLIAVNVLTSNQELKESASSPVQKNEASKVTLSAYVRWTGDAWTMIEVEIVQ